MRYSFVLLVSAREFNNHLEPLTKMAVKSIPTDHRVRQMHQHFMDIVTLFVAYPQSAKSLLPTECALDYPTKATQALAAVHTAPRNPRHDPTLAQPAAQGFIIIRLVGMQFGRPTPWTPTLPTN